MSSPERDRQRRHDRECHLDRLLVAAERACHWYGRPIVRVRELREAGTFLRETHFTVEERVEGARPRVHQKATMDHVVPLSRGGSRRRENLVAACALCNARRNKADQVDKKKEKRTWRDRHPVPDDDRELGDPGA